MICGGDEVESIYGTGSNLPGAVQNLIVNYTTEDKIVIIFDHPERNGTELVEYEAHVIVMFTYSKNLWAMRNITKKAQKTAHKFEFSDLVPATEYNITVISKGTSNNGEHDGGMKSIIAKTLLGIPDPKPEPPKIISQKNGLLNVEIKKASNNNGPVSSYKIIVHFVDNELIHDFDTALLNTYQKSKEDGLSYYCSAEIDAFDDDSITFTIGDKKTYGKYYNAPLPDRHLHIVIGVVSRILDEEKTAYSDSSHDGIDDLSIHFVKTDIKDNPREMIVILLTIACIICGFILVGSIIFYGYIKTRINPRMSRFERHEMSTSLQGPILEVDNNGFISDVSGINFKEKLQEVLLNLDDDQKIARKNLSLDIDNIIGIGSFGDVIRGQMNTNPCQVHVVSADDMDPPIQTKFLRDINNLLQFGFHQNMQSFMGVCQTHDWFFVIFEDTPATLKQFLLSSRQDSNLSSERVTNLSEIEALRFMYELGETLEYLQYNKIVHKNLNSFNVRIKRRNSAYSSKLSVFGPTLYIIDENGSRNMVDEDRWQAPEVLRFQKFSHASDVYSFGLVIWEICCLGATVYGSVATNDLLSRIKKGIRPDKYEFISEDLYQLMLNCWELDPNERPDINEVAGHLKQLLTSPHYYLNFTYDGQLPYYLPLLEIKN